MFVCTGSKSDRKNFVAMDRIILYNIGNSGNSTTTEGYVYRVSVDTVYFGRS